MKPILFEKRDHIAWIRLNRPDVYNSFNREMALQMHDALDQCRVDNEIRVVFITGAGKAFCAGQDLKEAMDPDGPGISTIVAEHYNPMVLRIMKLEKPVIAAVNGVAAGAGANLALACDITVAKKSAHFIQAFSKIGLIPDTGGTFMLPRIVGRQRANALAFFGDKISADEAASMGMIYKAIDDEGFMETASNMAHKLAGMPTKGIGLTKRAFNLSMSNDLSTQLQLEEQLQTEASLTDDYNEGVTAFLEKRKPIFKGA